jgi:hypothetical protein
VTVAIQVWNPDDWEAFCLTLLQDRHGALNIHKIPAAHKGDFGLDYYCSSDAVAYQCYAVEEPVDIVTRAERQKNKITTDLRKIIKNQEDIKKLFLGSSIRHWKLLVPLHDSKEVNLHCSKKTGDMRKIGCPVLDPQFEVGIHDQSHFPPETIAAGISSVSTVRMSIPMPTGEELSAWRVGSTQLISNATRKLSKRAAVGQIDEVVSEAARSFLQGSALLDALRNGSPDLHDRIVSAINSRARRLGFVGPTVGANASVILGDELDSMVKALSKVAPNLSTENTEQIAYGAISEWILRCPLDFPDA